MNTPTMVLRDLVTQAVRGVVDPELGGITIGDLGLVHEVHADDNGVVVVELLPTFLGCPALALMATDVQRAALLVGATSCTVHWQLLPPWDSSRISPGGVAQLGSLGIAVARGDHSDPSCPTCGHEMLRPVNPVGATACRAVAWCGGCHSAIDVMGTRRG